MTLSKWRKRKGNYPKVQLKNFWVEFSSCPPNELATAVRRKQGFDMQRLQLLGCLSLRAVHNSNSASSQKQRTEGRRTAQVLGARYVANTNSRTSRRLQSSSLPVFWATSAFLVRSADPHFFPLSQFSFCSHFFSNILVQIYLVFWQMETICDLQQLNLSNKHCYAQIDQQCWHHDHWP